MALLLYKSNEMFSSTELIRKSKTIFNKIIDHEIEKAVIMRDGKPGFLLMDFQKYESIMQEFEDLKAKYQNSDNPTTIKIKEPIVKEESKIEPEIEEVIEDEPIEIIEVEDEIIEEDNLPIVKEPIIEKEVPKEIIVEKKRVKPSHVVPPRPKMIVEQESCVPRDEDDHKEEEEENLSPDTKEEEKPKYEEPSEEEEINTALDRIKSMNFDDSMRKIAEAKIKEKILRARKERAIRREQEELLNKQDLKEELELQVQIKEQNKKKERELREFWD